VFAIRHCLDRPADAFHAVCVTSPAMRAAKKPPDRLPALFRHAGDGQQRQQVLAPGEADDTVVKIAEGNTPFHRHWAETLGATSLAEQDGWILRLDMKPLGPQRLEGRSAQLAHPRHGLLGRGEYLRMPVFLKILDTEKVGAHLAEQFLERKQRRD